MCIRDRYSGADKIDVFQGVSKGGENKLLVSTSQQTAIKLTDNEKNDILTKVGGQTSNSNKNHVIHGTIKDFSYSGDNVRYGGKLSFGADTNDGTYIKVTVTKPSSVYRFVMKMPNQPVVPVDPGQNPTPGQPCNVSILSLIHI